jgi:ribosomal protein S21
VVRVNKKDGETVEAMLRRFKKKLIQSGVLQEARGRRFYERQKSKNLARQEAQTREKIRQNREHLRKIGKLEIKPKRRGHR